MWVTTRSEPWNRCEAHAEIRWSILGSRSWFETGESITGGRHPHGSFRHWICRERRRSRPKRRARPVLRERAEGKLPRSCAESPAQATASSTMRRLRSRGRLPNCDNLGLLKKLPHRDLHIPVSQFHGQCSIREQILLVPPAENQKTPCRAGTSGMVARKAGLPCE